MGNAGEYLSDEMAESYAAYRGRLRKRHALGKAADKLVKITDKYLPRITDEARVYIMKFIEVPTQDPGAPQASPQSAEKS